MLLVFLLQFILYFFLFLKMGHPRPLFHLFLVFFKQTWIQFFTTNQCEKCPSSLWCRDSNPQPSYCQSHPFNARPGLPPTSRDSFFVYFHSFQTQILQKKTVDVRGIRTLIVRVKGKHADHLTTTTAAATVTLAVFLENITFRFSEDVFTMICVKIIY